MGAEIKSRVAVVQGLDVPPDDAEALGNCCFTVLRWCDSVKDAERELRTVPAGVGYHIISFNETAIVVTERSEPQRIVQRGRKLVSRSRRSG